MDGLIPLAHLLNNAALKNKAERYIEWTLHSQQANGMFGPQRNDDWWPRIVMLKALAQYQEATADPRVAPFMHRYFLYQLAELPRRPLKEWGRFRWQDQVLTIIWLYNRTGDPKLLELARLLHQQGYDWTAEFAKFPYKKRVSAEDINLINGGGKSDLGLATHGVNKGQAIKAGPVWSLISGLQSDRNAAAQMMAALNTFHGLPNDMFSCDEHLAGLNPTQDRNSAPSFNTCCRSSSLWQSRGDPAFSDYLEKLAFCQGRTSNSSLHEGATVS